MTMTKTVDGWTITAAAKAAPLTDPTYRRVLRVVDPSGREHYPRIVDGRVAAGVTEALFGKPADYYRRHMPASVQQACVEAHRDWVVGQTIKLRNSGHQWSLLRPDDPADGRHVLEVVGVPAHIPNTEVWLRANQTAIHLTDWPQVHYDDLGPGKFIDYGSVPPKDEYDPRIGTWP